MRTIFSFILLLTTISLAAAAAAEERGAPKWRPAGTLEEADGPAELVVVDDRAWRDFMLEGPHFFFGASIGPAMTGVWPYAEAQGPELELGMLFAVRLGLLVNRTELALEVAPLTWLWRTEPQRKALAANLSVGGLVRIGSNVSWPLRFGLGVTMGDLPNDAPVHMNGRLDVIGLAYQAGHVIIEVDLPSVRFSSDFSDIGIWNFLFNLSFSYII